MRAFRLSGVLIRASNARPLHAPRGARLMSTAKPPSSPPPPQQPPRKPEAKAAEAKPQAAAPAASKPAPPRSGEFFEDVKKFGEFDFFSKQRDLPLQPYGDAGQAASYMFARALHFGGISLATEVFTSLRLVYNFAVAHPAIWTFLSSKSSADASPEQQKRLFSLLIRVLELKPDRVENYFHGLVNIKIVKKLPKVLSNYRELINAHNHVYKVEFTVPPNAQSPILPTAQTIRSLFKLEADSTIIKQVRYEDIGGGIKVQCGMESLDFSFGDKLSALDKQLENAYQSAKAHNRAEFMDTLTELEKYFNVV